jgi:hypothetical protein
MGLQGPPELAGMHPKALQVSTADDAGLTEKVSSLTAYCCWSRDLHLQRAAVQDLRLPEFLSTHTDRSR